MSAYTQEFKRAYLDEFYRQLWSKTEGDWGWLHVEDMVGSVYLLGSEGRQIYCSPGAQQYLGGEEIPDNDNIGIHFQIIDGDGVWIEDAGGVVDFTLTYCMEQDLHVFYSTMTAYRLGLLRFKEAVNA